MKFTGCQSQGECERAAEILVGRMKKTPGAVAHPEILSYDGMDLGMVKCDFDIGFSMSLERAFPIIERHFPGSTYEPASYCGLKTLVQLDDCDKPVTVCLFHTGKAFVSGRMTLDNVACAFDKVASVLFTARDTIEVSQKQTVVNPRKRCSAGDMPSLEELLGMVLDSPRMPVSLSKRSAKTQMLVMESLEGPQMVEVPVVEPTQYFQHAALPVTTQAA